MEYVQFFVLQIRYLVCDLLAVIHNQHIGSHYRQKQKWYIHHHILKMTFNLVSTERHQFLVMHIRWWRHCMGIWAFNWPIDLLHSQKYNILKKTPQFIYYWYRNLKNMNNVIAGCQRIDFERVLLSNSNNKSVICIYRWTGRTISWSPVQFWWAERYLLNLTLMPSFGSVGNPHHQSSMS
jgi:hypothetical protein